MAKADQKRQGKPGGKRLPADTSVDHVAPSPAPVLPGTPPPGSALPAMLPPPVAAERALQERQRKQKWTGLPAKGKVQKTVKAIQVLKLEGFSTNEIAEKLGIKPASIRQYMWIAGQRGWLDPLDPFEKAHNQLIHRAVSNAEEWLTARDKNSGLPDKEFTLEAMKGLGVFSSGPSGSAQQNDHQAMNVLAINITMPTGGNLPQMRDGNAGGTGQYIEAEVVNASPHQPGRLLPK